MRATTNTALMSNAAGRAALGWILRFTKGSFIHSETISTNCKQIKTTKRWGLNQLSMITNSRPDRRQDRIKLTKSKKTG